MKKLLQLTLFLGLLIFTSCYSTSVVGKYSVPDTGSNGVDFHEVTFHSWLWGASTIIKTDTLCRSGSFHQVEVKDNFFYNIINVASIGFYKPIKVEYRCSKEVEN